MSVSTLVELAVRMAQVRAAINTEAGAQGVAVISTKRTESPSLQRVQPSTRRGADQLPTGSLLA